MSRARFHSRPRSRRRWWLIPVVLGVLLLLLAALATPIARAYVRYSLSHMDDYDGRVADVHATLFPPTVRMDGVQIIERSGGSWREPLLQADRVHVSIAWRKLRDFVLVTHVDAERPDIRIVQRSRSSESEQSVERKAKKLPDLSEQLQRHMPLKIAELRFHGGRTTVIDLTRSPHPTLTLSELEGSADNITTRRRLAEHRPTTVEASGIVQKSGRVHARLVAHPFAKLLDFNGAVEMRGLRVADLSSLLEATQDIEPSRGTVDIYADFTARDGHITGGVKPVLHDVHLKAPPKADLMARFKAWLADAAVEVFSEKQPDTGERRIATVIPIRGSVVDPKAQLWPTVAGIVRNAFVQGITSGFSGVPPATASKQHGPVKQVAKALTGKEPPKAEPQGKRGK